MAVSLSVLQLICEPQSWPRDASTLQAIDCGASTIMMVHFLFAVAPIQLSACKSWSVKLRPSFEV
jgi:hypothetical protein